MKLWTATVRVYATAYILAETAEEAQRVAERLRSEPFEFGSHRQQVSPDLVVTGEAFSPEMPPVSLSPAMTLIGADEGDEVEFVQDFSEEKTDDDGTHDDAGPRHPGEAVVQNGDPTQSAPSVDRRGAK